LQEYYFVFRCFKVLSLDHSLATLSLSLSIKLPRIDQN